MNRIQINRPRILRIVRVFADLKIQTREIPTVPRYLWSILFLFLITFSVSSQPARKKNAPPPDPPVTVEEASNLEAVITTEMGVIRMEFYPNKAPNHVFAFIKRARSGYYDGSAFFRVIARALIQGGDPILKENAPRAKWGTGALSLIKDEFSDLKHESGTVSTVRIPEQANSGGAQFFICYGPQTQLDGKFSAFGKVTEGLTVVEKISMVEADKDKKTDKPIRIISIKLEPKKIEPFKDATVDEMRKEVLLKTTLGDITIALDPDLAPEHVRSFLKLVETGWFDHTAFHRVIPGFVIQGGIDDTRLPLEQHPATRWVRPLKGEFSKERKHVRGILSMARGDDPDSAATSFFIMLGIAGHLDGKYTIFGKVVDGLDAMDRIERAPRIGETPQLRVEIIEAVIKP